MAHIIRTSSCACGQVRFEATGRPIVTAVCYCDDCQAGGRNIEALPDAPQVLEDDDGASYLTYRDDRFRCVKGADRLTGLKLRQRSPTTRYVATCCNSAMYLKYKRGHWVSAYRRRFDNIDLPPIEMRTNTRFRTSRKPIETDAPSFRWFPLRLFVALISSRIAMAIGR